MTPELLNCFNTCDFLGEVGVNIDASVAYRSGPAVGQHFGAQNVAVGFDAHETSPTFTAVVALRVCEAGVVVLDLSLCGTEEVSWAVTEFGACAGIEVTASHKPTNYKGMKIVKSCSRLLDDAEGFQVIGQLVNAQIWTMVRLIGAVGYVAAEARSGYVERVPRFVSLKNLKVLHLLVVPSGKGVAGPTFYVIAGRLSSMGAPLEFIRVRHVPDATFPNGIPNFFLPENHAATGDLVWATGAGFGVAFDEDFDRCVFFDSDGQFVPRDYGVPPLAAIVLEKEPGAKIVLDYRVILKTLEIVGSRGGVAVQSKTGHDFIKQTMREHRVVYGGEMSARHYFRDFAYCDSGTTHCLLLAELVPDLGTPFSERVHDRFEKFPSIGESNFRFADAYAFIFAVLSQYHEGAALDEIDGVSPVFLEWRVNLWNSNTKPLVRLNVEASGEAAVVDARVDNFSRMLKAA